MGDHSITKGIISNGLANIIQKSVRILDQLLLVPFFLTSWGAAYYGEWLTLSIIPSVLAFADLGFGSAVSNSFVLAYAAGDKQRAANLNKSGYLAISLSVALGILLTVAILLFGDSLQLFHKSLISAHEAILAVSLMMTARLLGFYNQLVEGYYRSARKAAWGSLLDSGLHVVNILVGLGVLLAGGGIVGYTCSQLIVSVVFTSLYICMGRRLIDLSSFRGRILKEDLKQITVKGLGYLMTPIWQSIYFQGGTFVVRLTLGAESVAVFNTVRTVCRSVNQTYSIINASIYPDLQYEYGRGNMQTVHRLFRIAVLFSMLIGIIGTMVLVFWGFELYEWWTQSVLFTPTNVWWVFMFGILFNAVWWTSVVAYRMTNQPYHFAIMSTVAACISVGCSYFLSLLWGLLGAAVGAVIYDAIMMFYVLPDSCHLLGMKVKDLFGHINEDRSYLLKCIFKYGKK